MRNSKECIATYVDKDLHARMKRLAQKERRTLSNLALLFIEQGVSHLETPSEVLKLPEAAAVAGAAQ